MAYPKFIITKAGYFRLGMVYMHKDLLIDYDICYGGGYYEFDYVSNRILLHGVSYDYGRPKWREIQTLHVPAVYRGLSLVYQYDNGEEVNLRELMDIDYYDE